MEEFKTRGTCSRKIYFDVNNNIIDYVEFVGGCKGNTQGVAKLCIGRSVDEVISLLDGIKCRNNTSCPDQFAQALKLYKAQH